MATKNTQWRVYLALDAPDLKYITQVIQHCQLMDNANEPDTAPDTGRAYIAADTPPIPIWKSIYPTGRIMVGHVSKLDLNMWEFVPAPRSQQPELRV